MQGIVHIVDDDASFLTAIERRLKKAGYEVAPYASAQHLLDRLPSETVPACILLDVRLPGLDGPALQTRLSELGSTLPIIFLTGHPDIPTTVQAIKAGADDFLTKPVKSDDLLRAIERAFASHQASRDLQNKLDAVRARIGTLTPRERQVFELVIRGKTNKAVARAVGGTERTIKAHRHRVMEKMQVRSVAELVSVAERVGVLDCASSSPPSLIEPLKKLAASPTAGTRSNSNSPLASGAALPARTGDGSARRHHTARRDWTFDTSLPREDVTEPNRLI